jgi:hypothetical protein
VPSRILGKQKPSILSAAALVSAMALAGIYVVFFSHAASGETANLWVNTSAGASPTKCSPACNFDPSKAYGSLNDAYQAASPGDTIIVKAGTYGDQNLTWSDKGGSSVVLRAENGTTPKFGSMGVETSNVTVIGPFTSTTLETNGSGGHTISNVIVESFTVDGGAKQVIPGYVASANGVTWKNVDISNVREVQAVIVDGGPGSGAQNITFDHLVAHDDFIALGSSNHTECLGLFGGWDITVKNSLFYRCTTFDVFVTWNDTQTGTNNANRVILENNVFEEPYDSGIPPNDAGPANYAVKWITPDPSPSATRGAIIRNNTFGSLLSLPGSSTQPTPVVTGNIFTGGSCAANTTYRYNVTTSQPCGTGDIVSSSWAIMAGYMDPSGHDWSLKSVSPVIGKADPANFPSLDILGHTRPSGLDPDAGAYEFMATGTTPPPSPTCTRAADINCDGSVNILDVTVVLSNFGKSVSQASDQRADTSGNGTVDIPDMTVVLSAFGT